MKILAVINRDNVQLYDANIKEHGGYFPGYRGLVAGRVSDIDITYDEGIRLTLGTDYDWTYLYVDLIQKGD